MFFAEIFDFSPIVKGKSVRENLSNIDLDKLELCSFPTDLIFPLSSKLDAVSICHSSWDIFIFG